MNSLPENFTTNQQRLEEAKTERYRALQKIRTLCETGRRSLVQGKMPPSVRERYMKMKVQPEHPENIDALIENFDRALSHPDGNDLERLRKIIVR